MRDRFGNPLNLGDQVVTSAADMSLRAARVVGFPGPATVRVKLEGPRRGRENHTRLTTRTNEQVARVCTPPCPHWEIIDP